MGIPVGFDRNKPLRSAGLKPESFEYHDTFRQEKLKIHVYRHRRTRHTVAIDDQGGMYMFGGDGLYHTANQSEVFAWLYND